MICDSPHFAFKSVSLVSWLKQTIFLSLTLLILVRDFCCRTPSLSHISCLCKLSNDGKMAQKKKTPSKTSIKTADIKYYVAPKVSISCIKFRKQIFVEWFGYICLLYRSQNQPGICLSQLKKALNVIVIIFDLHLDRHTHTSASLLRKFIKAAADLGLQQGLDLV